jgi:hypothetical protein
MAVKLTNKLKDGDSVLTADLGTVLDWTKAENNITVEAPEAYTKLYVAPKVSFH